MHELSPSLKDSQDDMHRSQEEEEQQMMTQMQDSNQQDEEEIDFEEENSFQIPPSFNCPINKETLWDEDHPYIFWASLHLVPIPKDLVNPMAVVYNAIEEFVTQLAEEDPHFVVFPHNLSEYKSINNLPPPIKTAEDLPNNIDKWLTYLP